jgi:predicted nucleic acid-binding Zn ribbon protein
MPPFDPDEGPSESDLDRYGGETTRCPHCGAEVYDEAEWCHKCGAVMEKEAHARRPTVYVAIVVGVLIAIMAFTLLSYFR